MRSLCRGLGRKTSAPKRAISKRDVLDAIISMAQQARPNVSGHSDDLRAQLKTWSTLVVTKFCSNWFCINEAINVPVRNHDSITASGRPRGLPETRRLGGLRYFGCGATRR